MRSSNILSTAAMLALWSAPVLAHHSYAMFEMKKDVELEGTVKNFQWTNPHIWIDIVVTNKATGKPENWSIEGSAPTVLKGYGWRQDSVKEGDKVNLVIHPLRTGGNGGTLAKIIVNGKEISTK
jgi:hypothetical protein